MRCCTTVHRLLVWGPGTCSPEAGAAGAEGATGATGAMTRREGVVTDDSYGLCGIIRISRS
jgi:hypothetical protein